jgi:hypothetical protein
MTELEAPRTLTKADVEAIAEQVNVNLFEVLGFDISTTKGRLEAQGAFRHLMFWYRLFGTGFRAFLTLGGTAFGAWLIWKLTGWAGPAK